MEGEGDQAGSERPVEWLPPQAPGAQPPPGFDPERPDPLAQPPPAAPPSPPQGVGGPAPSPQSSAQPPYPLPPAPPSPPRNDRAVLALLLGVSGMVAFLTARLGLLFFLNLPPAVAAWVIGAQARNKVDRGETSERRGMATAGMVLGIVGTALGVLAMVGWGVGLALSPELRRFVLRHLTVG
jgi:hypothetical protein